MLAADTDFQIRLHAAATLRADPHELAHAVAIEHLERIVSDDLSFDIVREKPLESSRLKPKVVCVRSLVPNEKKSACRRCDRPSAPRAAARSSCRHDTRSSCHARPSPVARLRESAPAACRNSSLSDTSGTMISSSNFLAFALHLASSFEDRATLAYASLQETADPDGNHGKPSIGLASRIRLT